MSHVDSGPLATYSSLQDKHLVGYFNNSRMRRHLRRSGLVTRNGEIITENTFRLNMARKEHQKHVRDLMAQAIVHKALDMERHRQSQIKRKLEEISKVELVQRVRSTRGRKGDEDITPYLSPRAPRGRPKSAKQERPRSVVSGHRPATAPSKQAGATKKKSAVYVDGEGFPVHRDQAWAATASDSSEEIDSQNLRELDPYIMNNITLNMSPEERQSNSPYKVDLTLPPEPRPPTRAPPGSRKTPRGSSRSVITKDGRRIRPKSNKGSLSLHRKEPAYPHAAQQQTLCDVTIRYRASNLKLQYERQDKRDEIIINQQHCGGENLVVFHGLVEPGTDLVFTSRRHRGYPFSLTFYMNQIQVLRLSACCEYKYGPGVLLGGRKGHFKFGRVDGGSPCYRCMVEAELARRERQRYKDTQTEEPKPEPEPEPVLESQGTQSDPPPPETRDQNEQAQADEEAEKAEGGYDDEDFEDEDVKEDSEKEDAAKSEEKNSDHFFSGPESDAEQKQPDDADYDADSDFEVESNHGKQKEEVNELDEEIKADVKEEEEVKEEEDIKEEVDEEDAVKEVSEDEPIYSEIEEAEEGNKEDGGVPQEVTKEEDDTHEVPEEKEPQVKEADKHSEAGRQSSAHDDSDSDSDGEDHNKVFSSSSSSFSSSEDEADKKVPDTVVASSSDSDSDDNADRKTKEVEQDKDDVKDAEIPSKDEHVVREEEGHNDTDKDTQASAEEVIPAKDRKEVERKDVDLNDDEEDNMQADEKREPEVKDKQPSSSLPENPKDTNDSKADQDADDDVKEENNTSKEKQEEEGEKEESDKADRSLVDKIKSMFPSSDSDSSNSSSDSDSDGERKKKKKHRKKKGEAKREDSPDPVEIKSGSDSDSEKASKVEKSDSEREDIKAESKEEMQDDAITQDDSISKEGGNMTADVDHSEDNKEKIKDVVSADEEAETGAISTMLEEKDQKSDDQDGDAQSQSERLVSDEENGEDKGDAVSLGKDTSSENRNDSDAQTKDDSVKPESDIEKEDQKSEEPDQDSQSRSERLVSEEEKDEDKGDTASPRSTALENRNDGDAQTKDDPEKPESDNEKEDQKSEEPGRNEDSQSQSERLVSDEDKDEDKGDTASPRIDTASGNMDDGDAQTKDDDEKSESDAGKRDAPNVQIDEATSDAEQKEEDDEVDEKEAGDSERGEVDSNKIDEDDEKQMTDTEKEDVKDDQAEEDNDAGKLITSSDEKEADQKQNTTEDEDEMEKEVKSKQEAVQGDEDKEQKEEVEVKQDEIKDEDKTEDDPKEEVNPEGSLTSHSSVSDSGSIATGLDKNYRILNLNAKNLDERKAGKLAKALKQHKYRNLEYLLLRENSLTDAGVATVIGSLIERHNESTSADDALKLTHLDLGNSGMGDESAAELARLLTLDTQLRNLNISENKLSTAAWASIIDHIKSNKSLVTLSAEYAHLSDTSCVMLMDALADHEKLEELNIEGNGLGERAGKAVSQLVKDNSIITSVNFERDNSISPKVLAEVKEILETGSYVP